LDFLIGKFSDRVMASPALLKAGVGQYCMIAKSDCCKTNHTAKITYSSRGSHLILTSLPTKVKTSEEEPY